MAWLGGNAWIGGGCVTGGGRARCEALQGHVLDAFGRGHYDRDPDGLHAQDSAVTAHVGQRAELLLELAAAQALPATTTVCLDELEAIYGLPPPAGLDDAARRARLAARRRGTDGRVASILAAVRAMAPDATAGISTAAAARFARYPLATLHLGVTLGAAWLDERVRSDATATVRAMIPSHWTFSVGRNPRFRCGASAVGIDLLSF